MTEEKEERKREEEQARLRMEEKIVSIETQLANMKEDREKERVKKNERNGGSN